MSRSATTPPALYLISLMKIAVPTRDGHIDDHFGHCAYYTIFDIENGQIIATSRLESPEGCGCKSGIAADMEKIGIEVMLAGNMGEGAKNKLESHNIKVIRGCRGDIEMVVRAYLIGLIKDSGEGCSHHECHSH